MARQDELPTGTLTLLFSDIEGSTGLLDTLGPDRYSHALASHRECIREAISRQGGVEVDTQGDSFFVVFTRASGALTAAEQAQRTLEIPVRMGIHTGEPTLINGGYVGIDVHRAARICSAAHGRQVLVSEATRNLVEGFDLRGLGEHRLKDLGHLICLYQLGGEEFPPLRSLNETNLPVLPTPLVGRNRELAELQALLARDDVRLLTMTGPGGTGKTRLALQVAAERIGSFADGVFVVALAPIRDPQLVPETVASVLKLKEQANQTITETLADYLAHKQLLLLLDNFEQVLEAAAHVAKLLATAPRLKVLVTSRAPLRLSGEHEYAVLPLPEPDALTMFIERARATRNDFEVTPENELAIRRICERLDGLPLALELAAARIRMLSPRALLERLERRLPLLTGGARDLDDRQRTLEATISWSYDLLSDREKALFPRLSVFVGGWTLEAAEAVCGGDHAEIFESLCSLVEQNLVHGRTREGHARFSMLETVREYAAARLAASDTPNEWERRHAEHLASFAEENDLKLVTREQQASIGLFDADIDNFRAALDWASRTGEGALEARLAAALGRYWYQRSLVREGLSRLEHGLTVCDDQSPEISARLLGRAATLAWVSGDPRKAKEFAGAARSLWESLGDLAGTAEAAGDMGVALAMGGDLEAAREELERSQALARQAEEPWLVAQATNNLAECALMSNDPPRARALASEAVALIREIGLPPLLAASLQTLGAAAFVDCDEAEAEEALDEALAVAREAGITEVICAALAGHAELAIRRGETRRAASMLGALETLLEASGISPQPSEAAGVEHAKAVARKDLGELAFENAVRDGHAMTLDEAVDYARGRPEDRP
jgi:predicted ATPase